MENIAIRFSSVEETKRMLTFLYNNQAILAKFKNDNNNLNGSFSASFTYGMEGQVPSNERGLYLNVQVPELAPYIWKLCCWMSFHSTYRIEGIAPILLYQDEFFRITVNPTGRGNEMQVDRDGLPVEKGFNLGVAWKLLHRNKAHNDDVFKTLIWEWKNFEKTEEIKNFA